MRPVVLAVQAWALQGSWEQAGPSRHQIHQWRLPVAMRLWPSAQEASTRAPSRHCHLARPSAGE